MSGRRQSSKRKAEDTAERNVLEESIDTHFRILVETPKTSPHTYLVHIKLHDPYWQSKATCRFNKTLEKGILYRPIITNEIFKAVESCLKLRNNGGIMIKGPQGIGKSHSIVNVIRKLQSSNKYLVTYIPNCDTWDTTQDLVDVICASFGTNFGSIESLFFPQGMKIGVDFPEVVIPTFISAIDSILKEKNKKWVFVFDQINHLFKRFPTAKDVGALPFPFKMMKKVMVGGRITSVISASANNEVSYRENHQEFDEYIHKTSMTREEIKLIFRSDAPKNLALMEQWTGNIPLYVREFIGERNILQYIATQQANITLSVSSLRNDPRIDRVALDNNTIRMLLKIELDEEAVWYDRKYFLKTGVCYYEALLPMAENVWRKLLWEQMLTYLRDEETKLVAVYNSARITADTRGRLFELIVIQRCMFNGINEFTMPPRSNDVAVNGETIAIPAIPHIITGSTLPDLSIDSPNGVYVPIFSNYPAIDMIWKMDNHIVAVQIHVNKNHKPVYSMFLEMCEAAGWIDLDFNICLLYLCPNESCMVTFRNKIIKGKHENINVSYLDARAVSCLDTLQLNFTHP
jgi:hypothetical protein